MWLSVGTMWWSNGSGVNNTMYIKNLNFGVYI